MKLTIDIDLNTDSREQIAMVANLLNTVTNASRRPTTTQPQVVNSGSEGSGFTLSPSDPVVTGEAVPAAEAAPEASPVPVKEAVKRTRRTKAEMEAAEPAPAPEVAEDPKPVESAPIVEQASTAPTDAPATVDDVRAALQAFTAAQGVDASIALLKSFGAARISELKAEQYGAFIGKCGAV